MKSSKIPHNIKSAWQIYIFFKFYIDNCTCLSHHHESEAPTQSFYFFNILKFPYKSSFNPSYKSNIYHFISNKSICVIKEFFMKRNNVKKEYNSIWSHVKSYKIIFIPRFFLYPILLYVQINAFITSKLYSHPYNCIYFFFLNK